MTYYGSRKYGPGHNLPRSKKIKHHIQTGITDSEYQQIIKREKELFGTISHSRYYRYLMEKDGIVFRERYFTREYGGKHQ